jgi:hypothetical protein
MYLRECTVVPDVPVMRETVPDVTQSSLLYILLDGIEWLFFGDLHFGIGPTRDFYDHVKNAIVLVSKQRDVVEGGYDGSILFDEYSML